MSKISVILSTYNQEKTICETIDSILLQSYSDFELIIVNDSSTDDTLMTVTKYLEDKRIQVITIQYAGLSRTRNAGAEIAKGDFYLFIDGDDKIDPTFLEKTLLVLEENPTAGFCYTDTQHFGASSGSWEQPEYDFPRLLQANYICSCSLIRKQAFMDAKGFNPKNFGYWEDYEFWIKLGSLGWYGKHLSEKLFLYRVHINSAMQSDRNTRLGMVYRTFITSQFPNIYSRENIEHAQGILSLYPEDFMEWSFKEQEQFLEGK